MSPGYYWALISHTGEIEIVEILENDIVLRIGENQPLEMSQIEVVKNIPHLQRDEIRRKQP
jgi:catalase